MGIYLDNAATSYPKPIEVAKSVYDFMVNNGTSSGRGSYKKAMDSDLLIYETRKLIGNMFNFKDPKRVIFTSNITESLNLAIRGILKENDHVITSSLEHNSVWRCLKTLEKERNITITKIPATKEGYTNHLDIEKNIKSRTSLIVFTHASNVLGTIQPIKEIGTIARKYNIPFLVDTAQSAGSYKIDIESDNIDLLAFTGHKSLLGPMGVGGLIINSDISINPLKVGGTGGDSKYEYQPDYYPNKLETGTLNVSGIVGLRESIKFINRKTIDKIHEKENYLTDYALQRLKTIKNIKIYGPKNPDEIVSVISFNIKNIPAEEVAYYLDNKYDIMVRSGIHCSPNAHSLIGTTNIGSVRIGLGYFNEKEDIDKLVEALNEI
ncbi:MAG: aminotransferase class V-fold PLP-dependent enzyme [Romboutsia sp.]